MSDYTNSLKLPSSFSFSFSEISHFAELSENAMENTSLQFTPLSTQTLLSNQPEDFSFPLVHNLPNFSPHDHHKPVSQPATNSKRKRQATAKYLEEEDNSRRRKEVLKESTRSGNSGGGEKQKEVVHVRARRGQATDSHSLAERVRRERINEKMRCLQDLVPGCYKTMGTATMLDEIINYVHSLQNQVEFLSMKLSAASAFYDFDMDVQSMAAAQQMGSYQNEPQNNDKSERYQSYGSLSSLNWPSG